MKQTEKSKYPSLYSPGKYITAAQYIIELICEKKAQTEKRDLPKQFWKLPEWKKFFSSQLRKCHLLLKKYDEKAIIKALRNKRARNIYSLFAPWLVDIIETEQRLIKISKEKERNNISQDINRNTLESKPRQHIVEDNSLSQLLELDNNE